MVTTTRFTFALASLAALFLLQTQTLQPARAVAPTALPIPCAPGACNAGAQRASTLATAGAATAVATSNTLKVTQTSNSAVLNWSSFDIGANSSVTFSQPSSSAIALNKIFQGSPSQIFGKLSSNGQIYLVNLNGFLFGPTASVNTASLVVSSLPLALSDANFASGILTNPQSPIFDASLDPLAPGTGRISVLDANGNPLPQAVQVVVQPGATLAAAEQGRVFLAGQNVTNGGTITAPDGQVILAAGQKVFLQADNDPSLRGLIVEVDQIAPPAPTGPTSTPQAPTVSKAWNQLGGLLSAPRGNITMVGLAVNQDGRISATTSVSANGSIRLEAAAKPVPAAASGEHLVSSQGGSLTIGPQSEMDILPELASSATEVSVQTQLPSTVNLLGEQVILQGGTITAPGGTLTAIAATNPATGIVTNGNSSARLRIEPGTSIDLSGSQASLPVTANLVEGQLRSSELANDPTQRSGALHGATVFINQRLGSPPIANLQGEIDSVPATIAQRTETGGNAVFQSEGDLVFANGASVNVSGGASTYAGGVLQTSQLVGANGQLYPIETANPLLTYVGVVNPTFSQAYNSWGVKDVLPTPGLSSYQPGYVQGANAGKVSFAAPAMILQGTLSGAASNGLYQRTPSTSATGGQLVIGLLSGVGNTAQTQNIDYLSPSVRIGAAGFSTVVSEDASLPPMTLALPSSYLTSSGFTSTQIYSNGDVTLPAGTPLILPPGATLQVNAASVNVQANITDSGGTLGFQNVGTVANAGTPLNRSGVTVADGVTLDVRGQWTNDAMNTASPALAQTWQNGGSISLGVSSPGALLSIGNDVTLRASGGAWLQQAGALLAGTGGSIAMIDESVGGGFDLGQHLAVDGFGVNGAAGGTFSLTAPRIDIGAAPGAPDPTVWTKAQQVDEAAQAGGVFALYPSLFSNFGFQTISIGASALVVPSTSAGSVGSTTIVGPPSAGAPNLNAVLTIEPGTVIDATVASLQLNQDPTLRPSRLTLDGIAAPVILPAYLRPSAVLSFTALPPPSASQALQIGSTSVGDVLVGSGASIVTDVGGSISLTSLDSILVAGTLRAPAGAINLQIVSPVENSNRYGAFDSGFLPNQRIELGVNGVIDVAGTSVAQPSTFGFDAGSASAGGTVTLLANRGAVVTDLGSTMSIAGASVPLEVLQPSGMYAHEVVATAAGSIEARSGESISLLGTINGAAGVGTSGVVAGGALDVELTRAQGWWGYVEPGSLASFASTPLTVELVPSLRGTLASTFDSNRAVLGTDQLTSSGIDALRLLAGDVAQFSGSQFAGPVSLSLGRQLIIDAPVLDAVNGARANFSAPYTQVGYGSVIANPYAATGGSGWITFSASQINLLGASVVQDASTVTFNSAKDIVLAGEFTNPNGSGDSLVGGFTVAGNLLLNSSRLYPATATQFTVAATEPSVGIASSVTFGQTGVSGPPPLSAGGALSISADTIASSGSIYAPFGSIALAGNTSVMLGSGSVTSVSGNGLTVPYGATQFGGQQWIYVPAGAATQQVSGVPSRRVSISAPAVTVASKATIDLSGGGDLSAYEWVPGPGGSSDALAPGAIPGLYAVLPSMLGQFAPLDPQLQVGSTIAPAESVFLSGVGGLASGVYPLLPARYALSPGAYLIQMEPKLQSNTPGTLAPLTDGTPVVAGYLTYGNTGLQLTPGYTGFAVYPGSYGKQLASYSQSLASTFFSALAASTGSARPVLPADAGTLSIAVGKSLDATGAVLTAAASGGINAPIEISANDLVVGSALSSSSPSDAVLLSPTVLSSWQAGSLLIGGTETGSTMTPAAATSVASQTSAVTVNANSVTIAAGSNLSADEIVLVANQSIDVQPGASVLSTSAISGTAPKLPPAINSVILTGSAGATPALLAVSDRNWWTPLRAPGLAAGGAGTVTLDSGAQVASKGALSFDGVGGVLLNGSVSGAGAEWSLGSSGIALGVSTVASGSTDTLAVSQALLTQLNAAAAVRLASPGAIDIAAPLSLGLDSSGKIGLKSLILVASDLNNVAGPGGVAAPAAVGFGASLLTLEGPLGATLPTPAVAGPTGATLTLTAGELDLGPNAIVVNGFAASRANVSGAVVGKGIGVAGFGGDLTLAASGVTAGAAASTLISSSGTLAVDSSIAAPASVVPRLFGGALTLSAASLDVSGLITAPSGFISLGATHALTLESSSTVTTAGGMIPILNQVVATPGGIVQLSAGSDLTLAPGAIIDVSGAGMKAAGAVQLTAGGVASVGATLKGTAGSGAGATGGSFSLDAGSLAGTGGAASALDGIAGSLTTGGFTNAAAVRVRSGDLLLDAGNTLDANAVGLTADAGRVVIGGLVNSTSSALRGTIDLFGGNGVELLGGGALRADGAGAAGRGGTIELGAGHLMLGSSGLLDTYNAAVIRLDDGSTISAAGAGTLLLRAPATTGDIGIETFAADTRAVGRIVVEPVLAFNTANSAYFSNAMVPNDLLAVQSAVGTYMTSAGPAIAARLNPNRAASFSVQPGVEIVAGGVLTLPGVDLSPAAANWRFNGAPGAPAAPIDLTVRAGGDLTVAGAISDGFAMTQVGNSVEPTLLPGFSSSIRLIAGADLTSSNPLAVTGGGSGGSLYLSALVRSGTGNIDLAAAQDISVTTPGAGAYTAGMPAVAPGGTPANPYTTSIAVNYGAAATDANNNVVGIVLPNSDLLMSFPAGGGNVRVLAGRDVVGAVSQTPSVSNWQLREGGGSLKGIATPAEWGVNLAAYDWNFGALGGGDVRIVAGRDALNVSAAAADSLLPQYGGGPQYVTSGGLTLATGRDIGSAQVYLADGAGSVAAGGALSAITPPYAVGDPNVGSAFYLGSSSLAVTSRLGAAIDGVFNPSSLSQAATRLPKAAVGSYFSYGENSSLAVESVSGDVAFGAAPSANIAVLGLSVINSAFSGIGNGVFPASLSVAAAGGGISFGAGIGNGGTLTLYPSPTGQLNLVAAKDVAGAQITMADATAGSYATVATPTGSTTLGQPPSNFQGDLHALDTTPALVTAGGSITPGSSAVAGGAGNASLFSIPKPAVLAAGQDILDTTYFGQNFNPNDETLISAGRDVSFSNGYSGNGVSLGGPGRLDILAGRNFSLGFSSGGVTTTGNLQNANLPTAQGADLTIMTGLGTTPDYAKFYSSIIAPSTAYQAELTTYVETLQHATGLSTAAADAAYAILSTEQQRPFVDAVFFNELLTSGRAANATPSVGFKQGYAAIDALFPGSRSGSAGASAANFAGNLTLDFSRIYTLSGGNISLVVPGGLVDVGLASPPPNFGQRDPSTLGIVAEGAGNVDLFTRGDVNVNSSRIFTLGGGNILIWSDEGSIDAGRGAKSAVSAPPPSVLINSAGVVTLNFSGAAAGSGIRTIQTEPTTAPGNVDLIAPVGTVNAGDAGIGSAGNINIAAASVIGVSNINFGGTATGVPALISSIGASLSGASAAASGASNSAANAVTNNAAEKEAAAPLSQAALSWLDVFVTGLGEDNCKPEDIDCLKRQKTTTR